MPTEGRNDAGHDGAAGSSARRDAARLIAEAQDGLYNANFDPAVLAALGECKELCFDYNQTRPGAHAERRELLRRIVGSIGETATIEERAFRGWSRQTCSILDMLIDFRTQYNYLLAIGASEYM